jgi:adenosylhomocysteine nucleosidase
MPRPIAVLASMEQEIRLIQDRLQDPVEHAYWGRRQVSGKLADIPIVTAISGFGKVAAAATVASVLDRFSPSHVVFGGVAGGVGQDVDIGDIVIADGLVQHDFDASPLFERFVIPSLGIKEIPADRDLTDRLLAAAMAYLEGRFREEVAATDPAIFDARNTSVHKGLIASGDRFIDDVPEARTLLGDLPNLLAVEMEGAAVAQVCAERYVPFGVFRSISDRADQNADIDFLAFIAEVAAPVTAGVVEELLRNLG